MNEGIDPVNNITQNFTLKIIYSYSYIIMSKFPRIRWKGRTTSMMGKVPYIRDIRSCSNKGQNQSYFENWKSLAYISYIID